jgi:hypothetical protein
MTDSSALYALRFRIEAINQPASSNRRLVPAGDWRNLSAAISGLQRYIDCVQYGSTRPASIVAELRVERTSLANRVKRGRSNVNLRRRAFALTTLILMFSVPAYSEHKNSVDTTASVQSFLGRSDLTLKTPLRDYPSWLGITQENAQLRA